MPQDGTRLIRRWIGNPLYATIAVDSWEQLWMTDEQGDLGLEGSDAGWEDGI